MGRHVGAPSDGHQHGGRKPAKTLEFTLAISKPFFSLLNFHTLTLTLLLHVSLSDLKKQETDRCFHVRDMFRAAILLSRTAQKSKIQTALFSKQRMLSR